MQIYGALSVTDMFALKEHNPSEWTAPYRARRILPSGSREVRGGLARTRTFSGRSSSNDFAIVLDGCRAEPSLNVLNCVGSRRDLKGSESPPSRWTNRNAKSW